MKKILNLYSLSTDGINAAVHSIDWLMLYTDRFHYLTLIIGSNRRVVRGSSNGMAWDMYTSILMHKSLMFIFYCL